MTQSSHSHELPPQVVILDMLLGMMKTQAIRQAVLLNLAERVKDGPRSVQDLAEETHTHPTSLLRLFRALESLGFFQETEVGSYEQTSLSYFLRPGVPGSMYDATLIHGETWQWRPWEAMSYSMETGATAFDHLFGTPLFDHLAQYPEQAEVFHRAMVGLTAQADGPIAQGYDFGTFSTLVDIGGGYGRMLTAILRAHPQLHGILFDLPNTIDDARSQITSLDIADRCQLVAGDMFKPETIPHADAYIMRQIIKDWSDEEAVRILSNCRQAMNPGGRILVTEQVVLPGQHMSATKLIDLQLMVVLSGQERTEPEYRALFEAAGLHLAHIWPTRSPYSVLEGIV
ncbi:methyltransferase [Ktedonobacteria bacterium brp13]|nr:methyltransferase [Ktedonobacteria bacterium brp13]